MTLHIPRLPISLDPLIAEAKRRARRRRWLILSVLVVAAAAAAASLALGSSSGSGPAAAAGGRPVVHVVLQDPPSTVYFNLKTGRETRATVGSEMWSDRRTDRHRVVSTEGGRAVADQAWRSHYGPAVQAAAVDRFYAALATTDYRAALRNGKVSLAGRGTFDGRRVDWLRVTPRRDLRWYVLRELGEVGVDAHTFKPILLRGLSGKRYVYTRVLLATSMAYKEADFDAHGPRQVPAIPVQLAPGYDFGSPNPSAPHRTVVGAPWLTAGTTVAGLRLRAVTPFTIRKTKHHFSYGAPRPKPIQGLALVYGPAALPTPVNVYGRPRDPLAATRSTIVYEVPQGDTGPWKLVPADSIEVQTGYTTVGTHIVHTPWIGYLKEHGLYITISTSAGPRVPLQIARSLHAGK
jgi:hypothetical protein